MRRRVFEICRLDSGRLLPLGVLLAVLGLALSGVAVDASAPADSRPASMLAPLLLGCLAFAVGCLAGRR